MPATAGPRPEPLVEAVHRSAGHEFSKESVPEIRLTAGIGVDGDAHAGSTVKHRSRVRVDPTDPNLRQVHLIGSELFAELRDDGFEIGGGDLGENITTTGIDLLALPVGTSLRLGEEALIAVTGLRNPCSQIERFRTGLLAQVRTREHGQVVLKAGVMAVVVQGGTVRPGDPITVSMPPPPHAPLERV